MSKKPHPRQSPPRAPVSKKASRPVGLACLLLAFGASSAIALYGVLDTFYSNWTFLYGLSAFEPDYFERAFLFWFGGLALFATVGITVGLSLLLPGRSREPEESGRALPRWTYLLALLALALLLIVKFGVLHNSPTMDDENVYHFTARLLLQGKLSLPTDLPAEFFAGRWGVNDRNGRLYPMYAHGWPALLSLGYLIHAPWLISPLAGFLTVLLGMDFARRVYGASIARLTLLFFLISPFFIFTGATDLSPVAAALTTMIILAGAVRYLEGQDAGRSRWLWLCGLAAGLAFQSRQLNAISMATPIFLYLFYRIWKQHGVSARAAAHLAALVVPVGISLALYMAANNAMNGSPWLPSYVVEFASRGVKGGNPLGFGTDYPNLAGGTGVHTVGQGLLNTSFNLVRVNFWLLGWPFSLLLALAAPFNLWTRLILATIGFEAVLYVTFYNPGLGVTGPTYFYDAAVMLLILAASGLRRLGAWYRAQPLGRLAPRAEGALLAAILFVDLVMFVPMYVRSLSAMTEGTSLLPRTIEREAVHHAVVFVQNVQGPWDREIPYKSFAYHPRSNASFDDDVVILNDRGPDKDRAALAKYFPGRQGYIYQLDKNWTPRLTAID